jgi:hypothetical protein
MRVAPDPFLVIAEHHARRQAPDRQRQTLPRHVARLDEAKEAGGVVLPHATQDMARELQEARQVMANTGRGPEPDFTRTTRNGRDAPDGDGPLVVTIGEDRKCTADRDLREQVTIPRGGNC